MEIDLLFDHKYYILNYPEISYSTILPIVHYYLEGWKLGYNPSPFLNTNLYLAISKKLGYNIENPIHSIYSDNKKYYKYQTAINQVHFTNFNIQLSEIAYYLASKINLFDAKWYTETYHDIQGKIFPIEHYRSKGKLEKRLPSLLMQDNLYLFKDYFENGQDLILNSFGDLLTDYNVMIDICNNALKSKASISNLYDEEYYKIIYSEELGANCDPFLHYLLLGWRKGYNPSPYFNTNLYKKSAKLSDNENPLIHCLKNIDDNYKGNMILDQNTIFCDDVKMHISTNIAYMVKKNGLFDADWYKAMNPDLDYFDLDAWKHYKFYGAFENRSPNYYIDCTKLNYNKQINEIPQLFYYFYSCDNSSVYLSHHKRYFDMINDFAILKEQIILLQDELENRSQILEQNIRKIYEEKYKILQAKIKTYEQKIKENELRYNIILKIWNDQLNTVLQR